MTLTEPTFRTVPCPRCKGNVRAGCHVCDGKGTVDVASHEDVMRVLAARSARIDTLRSVLELIARSQSFGPCSCAGIEAAVRHMLKKAEEKE